MIKEVVEACEKLEKTLAEGKIKKENKRRELLHKIAYFESLR